MALPVIGPDPFFAKVCEALGEDPRAVMSIKLCLEAGDVADLTVRRLLSLDEAESLADAYEDAGVRFQKEMTYTCIAPKERESRAC